MYLFYRDRNVLYYIGKDTDIGINSMMIDHIDRYGFNPANFMVSNVMMPIDDLKGNGKEFRRLKCKSMITAFTRSTEWVNDKMAYLVLDYIDKKVDSMKAIYDNCNKLETLVHQLKSLPPTTPTNDAGLMNMAQGIFFTYAKLMELRDNIKYIHSTEYSRYFNYGHVNKDNIMRCFKLLKELNKAKGKIKNNHIYKAIINSQGLKK